MIFKEGVQRSGLQLEMRPVFRAAEAIWLKYGQELVVTAVQDGKHSAGSLHYYGLAVDLRTRYFSPEDAKQVYYELKEELPEPFDVVWHETHIHVEYDYFKI